MTRSAFERGVALPLLVSYVALLVLAAWRHEVRPALLDPPAAAARSLLRALGVTPAVAVFTSDAPFATDEKTTAVCVEVRVVAGDGGVARLYPERNAPCPAPSPRLWVSGEEIALYRSLMVLRAAVAARRSGRSRSGDSRRPELLAEWLAEHFRRRAAARGLAGDDFALRWRETRQSYATGERSERVVALLRWHSDPARPLALAWRPDAERLAAQWPGPVSP